jgi:HAD superfamily phosphoserine phosphatase-like hydrolase
VRGAKKVREIDEASEVEEKSSGVAAFFDLDGTLMALPSLEQRCFRTLRYRGVIPPKNYFQWLREALRLMPRGIGAVLQANKMYLSGTKILDERGEGDGNVSTWHNRGHQAEGQASALPVKGARRNPRLPVPTFFAQAIERVAWHARQGHDVVLISGTLEPLAREAARALEVELAAHGTMVTIRVIATRLEEAGGRWTGRILGEAMFGEAKAHAARGLALEMRLDLERCFAYGDSLNDRLLMMAVGRPTAVNPSNDLRSTALSRGWPILNWTERERITQSRRGNAEKKRQPIAIAVSK